MESDAPVPGVIVVLMGVTGAGKTMIGRMLARELDWAFYDADDLHPPANVEKMRRGEPLSESDRTPWLAATAGLFRRLDNEGQDAVAACSALRAAHRRTLEQSARDVRFILLNAPAETIAQRLASRVGHFMHPGLLPGQMETLEPPNERHWVDAAQAPHRVVEQVRRALGL